MELYDQDDLYQIMEFIIYSLQYKCYLKFCMPGSCEKSVKPLLIVVIPGLYSISIGIPLSEVADIKRDHPELGGE